MVQNCTVYTTGSTGVCPVYNTGPFSVGQSGWGRSAIILEGSSFVASGCSEGCLINCCNASSGAIPSVMAVRNCKVINNSGQTSGVTAVNALAFPNGAPSSSTWSSWSTNGAYYPQSGNPTDEPAFSYTFTENNANVTDNHTVMNAPSSMSGIFRTAIPSATDTTILTWMNQGIDQFVNVTPPSGGLTVYVTDSPYNAQGNGTTDDTAAIQAAVNAVAAGGPGGQLLFPPRKYLISSTINLPGDIDVRGLGRACSSEILMAVVR